MGFAVAIANLMIRDTPPEAAKLRPGDS